VECSGSGSARKIIIAEFTRGTTDDVIQVSQSPFSNRFPG
jgi:hypothetical protein